MPQPKPRRRRSCPLRTENLERRVMLHAGPLVISELMAENLTGLTDEDGSVEDWIEIHNPTEESVDLTGWYLTDDDDELTKWEFPAQSVAAGAYLTLFASGKDRASAGQELHTNFRLSGDGEYVGLVRSDGTTIASEIDYPSQLPDVSFGSSTTVLLEDELVSHLNEFQLQIPTDGAADNDWQTPSFDAGGWTSLTGPSVGYDTNSPLPAVDLKINFQPATAPVPDGYLPDGGQVFADRGNGFSYGWTESVTGEMRDRGVHVDQRFDTLVHMRGPNDNHTWEVELPNGRYEVFAVFGDPQFPDSLNTVAFEDEVVVDEDEQDSFDEFQLTVDVTDGRLTVRPVQNANNAKLAFLHITSTDTTLHGLFQHDLEPSLFNAGTSAYLRLPFHVADPQQFTSLQLDLNYDDGFVAYLNGQEVAADNVPAARTFDIAANNDRNNSEVHQQSEFDLTQAIDSLVVGDNLLAIHAVNDSSDSPEFVLNAALTAVFQETVDEQYFTTPTPGAENIAGALGIVKDTTFSVDRGFYDQPFQVAISSNTDAAEIRYTLDGSTPTESTGELYTGPIDIADTTVLRAIATKPGYLSSNVDTQTYLFVTDILQQSNTQPGYPNDWQGFNADYAMSTDIVNDPLYADRMFEALTSIPSMSIVTDIEHIFDDTTGIYQNSQSSGSAWERPTSLEFFGDETGNEFQINAGLRIQGGASRIQDRSPKHSFRLLFKNAYGPGKLDFPLFGDEATDSFDTIVLRAGYNNSWIHKSSAQRDGATFVTDQFLRDVQLAMGNASAHGEFVHLYLNGLYWGLYNATERPSAPFAAAYHGGDKDEYDALNSAEAIDGDTTVWNQMMALANAGLSTPAAYAGIQEYLDVENLIDYMILNIYGGNQDWDHHNWYAGRRRSDDGRYRFYSWDAERSLENPTLESCG